MNILPGTKEFEIRTTYLEFESMTARMVHNLVLRNINLTSLLYIPVYTLSMNRADCTVIISEYSDEWLSKTLTLVDEPMFAAAFSPVYIKALQDVVSSRLLDKMILEPT